MLWHPTDIKEWAASIVAVVGAMAALKKFFDKTVGYVIRKPAEKKNHEITQDPVERLGADFKSHNNLLWKRGQRTPYCLKCFYKHETFILVHSSVMELGFNDKLRVWACPKCDNKPQMCAPPRWK